MHATLMNMVVAPDAPEASRRETWLHEAQGAPRVFGGDMYYFAIDHDRRGEAERIDVSRCAVYLLTGAYDFFIVALSREAARQIQGAERQMMEGLGYFPMSEDPDRFAAYVLPVQARIAAATPA